MSVLWIQTLPVCDNNMLSQNLSSYEKLHRKYFIKSISKGNYAYKTKVLCQKYENHICVKFSNVNALTYFSCKQAIYC